MSHTYPYHQVPLRRGCNEIRLLRLDEADISSGSPLTCSFQLSTLTYDEDDETRPEWAEPALIFSAVSYTWGTNPQTAPMMIDGHLVQVPANSEKALRGLIIHLLRRTHEDDHTAGVPLLWIDALCIDQGNLTEKSQQVEIMGEIYSHADEVLVWLGDDGEGHGPELETLLDDVHADCARATDDFANMPDTLFPKNDQGLRGIGSRSLWTAPVPEHIVDRSDFTAHKIDVLTEFFSLPWFSRVWITQEILLAEKARLYWGQVSFSWPLVSLAAQWLQYGGHGIHSLINRDISDAVNRMIDATSHASTLYTMDSDVHRMLLDGLGAQEHGAEHLLEHSLASLLLRSDMFDTTEPRDSVYAFLGLLSKQKRKGVEDDAGLRPDYSLDIAMIYAQATQAILLTGGSTSILTSAGLYQASKPGLPPLPSWVPRYGQRSPGNCEQIITNPISDVSATSASSPMAENMSFPPNKPGLLRIKGHIMHTVLNVAPAIPGLSNPSQIPEKTVTDNDLTLVASRLLETWTLARTTLNPTQHTLLSNLRALVFGSSTLSTTITTHHIALTLCSGRFVDGQGATQVPGLLEQLEPLIAALKSYKPGGTIPGTVLRLLFAIRRWSGNRHFFVTAEGSVGMGPPGIRAGDRAAFMFGHAFPLILRPVEDHWLLVGDVYWTGHMDGLHWRRLRGEGTLDESVQWSDIR